MSDFERIRAELSNARRQWNEAQAAYQDLRHRLRETRREISAVARVVSDPDDPALSRLEEQKLQLENELAAARRDLAALRERMARLDRELFPDDDLQPSDLVSHLAADLPFLLFPVRVETRFARETPELLVRIYPDDVCVDSHECEVTGDEATLGQAYWEEAWPTHKRQAFHEDACRRLLRSLDPARGAWVVARTRPQNFSSDDAQPMFGPVEFRPEAWSRAPLARLLPDRWVVVGRSAGATVGPQIGRAVPDGLPVGPSPDEHAVPLESLDSLDRDAAWLVDFEAAVEVGMAVRVPLTASQAESGLDRLVVLGVKPSLPPEEAVRELEALIKAQLYTEGVALVPQGTATNNTSDGPSGFARVEADELSAIRFELGEPSYSVADEPQEASDGQRLASALGLAPDALSKLPHGSSGGERNAQAMTTALWPATWGYYLNQAMGSSLALATREATHRHAMSWVRGRGPLPTLRIGTMPYGILPCGRYRGWQPLADDEDSDFESGLVDLLERARPFWETAAQRVPHVAAAEDPDATLLQMLGMQASSSSYGLRWLVGPHYFWNLLRFAAAPDTGDAALLTGWQAHESAARSGLTKLGLNDLDPPLARSAFDARRHRWSAPLIQSEPLTETEPLAFNYIRTLARATLNKVRQEDFGPEPIPRALLYVLLRHAALRTYVDTGLKIKLDRGLIDEVRLADPEFTGPDLGSDDESPLDELARPLESVTGRMSLGSFVSQPPASSGAELQRAAEFKAALKHLADVPTAELERLMSETLDTASHRLDAWMTSLASKRLASLRAARPDGIWLGAYGLLENVRPARDVVPVPADEIPAFDGELASDADNGGFLLAPSLDQAKAAAVLRNAFLTHAGAEDPNRFAVDLSSRRVRRALALLEGVREGQPLGALLGYRIERSMHEAHKEPGDPELDRFVFPLRELFPLVAGRLTDPGGAPASATAAASVVDGLRLLRRFRDGVVPFATRPDLPAPGSSEHTAIVAVLHDAADDLDAVGDVLLAEGVYQSVRGNHARASVSLDNLAGAGPLAEPEVVRGARGRLDITHRALLLFSGDAVPPAGWTGETARALAAPNLDSWCGQMLGRADNVECRVQVTAPSGSSETVPVRLSDLGLAPLDFVFVSGLEGRGEGDTAGASELEERIADLVLSGRPAGSRAEILFERPSDTEDTAPNSRSVLEVLELARRLRQIVTKTRALGPRDLVPADDEQANSGAFEIDGPSGLHARAEAARASLFSAWEALDTALDPFHEDGPTAEPVPNLELLRTALRNLGASGIQGSVPLNSTGTDAVARDSLLAQARSIRKEAIRRDEAAAASLAAFVDLRATSVDPLLDGPKLLGFLEAALCAVFGKSFPVLPRFQAPNSDELGLALAHPPLLDPEGPDALLRWFQQTARVSEAMGRFELAMLLAEAAGNASLELQVAQLPFRAEDRWLGLEFDQEPDPGRVSLVVHAPLGLDVEKPIAGLLLDEVSEHIPNRSETAGLSFHFNRPTARAPQTLLLAVPNQQREFWSWEDLLGSVEETLELAKLRAVDLEVLEDLGHYLPAIHLAVNAGGSVVSSDVLSHLDVAEFEQ